MDIETPDLPVFDRMKPGRQPAVPASRTTVSARCVMACVGAVLCLGSAASVWASDPAPAPASAPGAPIDDTELADTDRRATDGLPTREGPAWAGGIALFPGYDTNPRQERESEPTLEPSPLFGARLFLGVLTPRAGPVDVRGTSSLTLLQLQGSTAPGSDQETINPSTALVGHGQISALWGPRRRLGLRTNLLVVRSSDDPVAGAHWRQPEVELQRFEGDAGAVEWPGRYEVRRTFASAYAGLATQGEVEAELGASATTTDWDELAYDQNSVGSRAQAVWNLTDEDRLQADAQWDRLFFTSEPSSESSLEVVVAGDAAATDSADIWRARVGGRVTPVEPWTLTVMAGWVHGAGWVGIPGIDTVGGEAHLSWSVAEGTELSGGYRRDVRAPFIEPMVVDEVFGRFRIYRPHSVEFIAEISAQRVAFTPLEQISVQFAGPDSAPLDLLHPPDRVDPVIEARTRFEIHLTELITAGAQHDFLENRSEFVALHGQGLYGVFDPAYARHRFLVFMSVHSRP